MSIHSLIVRTLRAAFAVALLAAPAVAQPTITSINASQLPRSGRLVLSGSGFQASGEVRVDGLKAWTATWNDARIVAWVPEAAQIGSTAVSVTVAGLESNAVPLEVTQRQSSGRVQWTFEADTDDLWYRPALGPDGTLYLHSSEGWVYALSSDGGLKWVSQVNWYPYVPPMTDSAGNVYFGSIQTITSLTSGGALRWQIDDPTAQGIQVAATEGPDGRLYGAWDIGVGAFAADPASGQVEWSNTGSPFMFDHGNLFGSEMVFGPSQPGGEIDQMYVHMDRRSGGVLYAFSLDGKQRFTTSVTGSISHEPVIASDGTILTPVFISSMGWGVMSIDPGDGTPLSVYKPENVNGVSELTIGPDDTIYFESPGYLEAFDATTGDQRWLDRHLEVHERPALSPDGKTLIVGGVPTYGQPGFIRGYDAATGAELWKVDLPGAPYPGPRILATDRARFTPDSSTAYVSTAQVSNPSDPHSMLFALDVAGEAAGMTLSVSGSCPGPVTVSLQGAPPKAEVALVAAAGTTGFTLKGKACPGTTFEIGEPLQLPPTFLITDGTGAASGNMTLEPDRCWVEALVFDTCETSPAARASQ